MTLDNLKTPSQGKKIIYYKLDSPYTEDYTKNCGLQGNEIDSNFFNLKEMDIISVDWDATKKELVLTRVNGEELRVKDLYENIEKDFKTFEFSYDSNLGILSIVTPVGKQEIKGFFVEDKITVANDATLVGGGCLSNPLGIAPTFQTGTYKPVKNIIDTPKGETPEKFLNSLKPVKGDRYVTKEYVGKFGRLYEYNGVKKLAEDLTKISSEWRIPTKTDWDVMLTCVEGCICRTDVNPWHDDLDSNENLGRYAGKRLKTKEYWKENTEETKKDSNYDENYSYSTEGTDSVGFSVLPLGYGDEHGNPSKGYGKYSAFWTSTVEDNNNSMYTKRFYYDKNTVFQTSSEPTERLSLRLVKTFNGRNFNNTEIINGMTYPCVLVSVPSEIKDGTIYSADDKKDTNLYGTVWTQINIGFNNPDYLPKEEIQDTEWIDKEDFTVRYFINDWNGKEWTKHELKEGESIVVTEEFNGVSMHEWRVIKGENGNNEIIDTVLILKEELEKQFEKTHGDLKALFEKESQERKDADNILDGKIESVDAKVDINTKSIEEETARAKDAEKTLDGKIENEFNRASGVESDLKNDIILEIARAKGEETRLDGKIDSEIERAVSEEAQLHMRIDYETERAKTEEARLDGRIDNEALVRESADTALGVRIDNEITARELADTALGTRIDEEASIRESADTALGVRIDEEELKRAQEDAKLQEEINKTQIGSGLAEDGSYIPNVSFTDRPILYIANATSLNDADVKLDESLQKLNNESIKEVIVNNVKAEVEDNVANVTIDTSDIKLDDNFRNITPDITEEGHLHIHSGDTVSMAFAKIESTYNTEKSKREESDTELQVEINKTNEKIDAFLAAANIGGAAVDTLIEIQDYIEDHGEEAARMVADIAKNREDIAAEVIRATDAENVLRTNLNNEITRARDAETSLNSKISDEISRATSVEYILRTDLNNEVSTRESNVSYLNERIVTEIARAENREGELNNRIDTVESNLANEIIRATGVESELNGLIISLQERMGSTETDVDDVEGRLAITEKLISDNATAITTEKTARESADTALGVRIDTLFSEKVEKEDGKGLSSNDFTNEYKSKLESVEEGAQVNKIEKIIVDDILLDITDNKEVKITMPEVPIQKVNVDDNILSLNGTELSANVSIDYDKEAKQIILYGKDKTRVISTIDTTDFIKHGMIEKVELVTVEDAVYIRIIWKTIDGNQEFDVKVNDLIEIYNAGNGLEESNNIFSIKLNVNDTDDFLKVDEGGLYTEGIKQYVVDEISKSETKTNVLIVNNSNVIANTQEDLNKLSTTVNDISVTVNDLSTDVTQAEIDITTLQSDIEGLKSRDVELEDIARRSFTIKDGNGVSLSLTPGTEDNKTNLLVGTVKGYFTYATKPEAERDSDYSLLRMTEDGHMFVTNSTSAMKHIDINSEPQVLSTYVNTLRTDCNTVISDLKAEVERAKASEELLRKELNNAMSEIENLKEKMNALISGENNEFMTMLKKSIINNNIFPNDTTDPTIEVIVNEGEKVLIQTKEDAVYEGYKIS